MDKKKVIKFIAFALGLSWIIQIVVCILKQKVSVTAGNAIFTAGLSVVMFMPLIASVIAKTGVKNIGWKPRLKGNVKWIFFAVFMPVLFSLLGIALFYLIWPELFSLDGSFIIKSYEDAGMDPAQFKQSLEMAGMNMGTLILLNVLQVVTYAPFFNMLLAVGEEAGWRGFLYPELNKRFGRITTWIIGGVIWAAFHFPVMLMSGYEYGTNYIGAPVLGIATFTLTCIVWGIFCEVIYDKTKCIWFPALLHGSINAAASIYMVMMNAGEFSKIEKLAVLGPAPNGLISVIPAVIIAIILAVNVLKEKKAKTA